MVPFKVLLVLICETSKHFYVNYSQITYDTIDRQIYFSNPNARCKSAYLPQTD